ncbi:MAG: EI24 domain-containing protein [Burkholderiaceae bacterium]
MSLLLDAFWRAVAYCLHPRVMAISLLPLVLMVVLSFVLGYLFWDSAVAQLASILQDLGPVQTLFGWLDGMGMEGFRSVLAPLLVLLVAMPVTVVCCLLLVAVFMTPAMVALVGRRRFPALQKKQGGSLLVSVLWSLGSTLLALVVLVMSMPLWLIPPLVLILPPLIWGWLTYRVFAFDALAEHASADERREILKTHRGSLLAMGVLSGYLGAAPSLLWASGALFVALAPLLVPLAIWIYTLVFAFASLWFAHFCLAALDRMRSDRGVEVLDALRPGPGSVDRTDIVDVLPPGPGASGTSTAAPPSLPEPPKSPF